MQSWLEERNWDSNTWERFTRSELKLESVHQESPRSDIFRKRATKPLLKQKQHQKHLTRAKEKKNWTVGQRSKVLISDESIFCISFGNQGPRVWRKSGEAQNQCCLNNLWGIVKRKRDTRKRDTRPNNADGLKAAIKATWASITPEQCHRLIASFPRRNAKGVPTKYWVHRNEHNFSKAWHFC